MPGVDTGLGYGHTLLFMLRPFLHAHWSNVAIISYEVPPDLLAPHVPQGCELDLLRGKAFVSLVAFDFDDVTVKGWHIPFHSSFPEVNLRFYVKRGLQRGVTFIREFVPKPLVAFVAKRFYNEPYETVKMKCDIHRTSQGFHVEHDMYAAGHTQKIVVATTQEPPLLPNAESDETWFKEHEWGFGTNRKGQMTQYRVAHPQWLTYHILWHEVKMDWKRVYGEKWKILKGAKPANVLLAQGSEVTVFEGTK